MKCYNLVLFCSLLAWGPALPGNIVRTAAVLTTCIASYIAELSACIAFCAFVLWLVKNTKTWYSRSQVRSRKRLPKKRQKQQTNGRHRVVHKRPAREPAELPPPEAEASGNAVCMPQVNLKRARFCDTCQCLKHDGPRHHHDASHIVRPLTQEEAEAAVPSQRSRDKAAQADVYRFTFGKHKGRTLAQVTAVPKAAQRGPKAAQRAPKQPRGLPKQARGPKAAQRTPKQPRRETEGPQEGIVLNGS